jgi:hypothetical protein
MKIYRIAQTENGGISPEMLDVFKMWQEEEESYLNKKTLNKDELRDVYIRFGEWSKDERSSAWEGNEKLTTHKGVSAFRAYCNDENDIYIIPTTGDESQHTSPDQLIDRNIYLITGDEVGVGPDDEPLLRNISIVKKLSPRQIMTPENDGENLLGEDINFRTSKDVW